MKFLVVNYSKSRFAFTCSEILNINDIGWSDRRHETNIQCVVFALFYVLLHWHYSPMRAFASIMVLLQTLGPRSHIWFPNRQFFTEWGCQPHAQPPAWTTRSHIYNPWDWVVQLYPQALGTHFSCLLLHAWGTVELFFNSGHHTGYYFMLVGGNFL